MLKSVLKVNRYSIFAYKFQLHFGFSFIKKFPAKMGKKSVKKELKERIIGLHLAQHSTREIKAFLNCVSQSRQLESLKAPVPPWTNHGLDAQERLP